MDRHRTARKNLVQNPSERGTGAPGPVAVPSLSPPPNRTPLHIRIVAVALLAPLLSAQAPQPHRFARENVLGTSAVLEVEAADRTTAERAEAAVFAEVERLDCVLSTWRQDSELAVLLANHVGKQPRAYTKVSADLAAMLERAGRLRDATLGAFDPSVAPALTLWTQAAKDGKAPTAEALQAAAAPKNPAFDLCGEGFGSDRVLNFDGIAKGFIVDRAAAAMAKVPGVRLVSFQIGGDTVVGAKSTFQLVDPRHPADNGTPLGSVVLEKAALASSGGYARGFDVAGVHHSHILDPRTGQPCDHVLGASVLAPDAATADALATALCVLGAEGLPLLASCKAHGVVVTKDGKVHVSAGFPGLTLTPAPKETPTAAADAKAWPKGFALQVDFEIKAPEATGGRGRGGWKRPYVAVWMEDLTGSPARTLCLWIEDKRWLRDLRRWNRAHAETPEFADKVSQATRKAGTYTLAWDGTDDDGRQLVPGTYFVCIEVVREHGGYQLIRKEVELLQKPITLDLGSGAEVAKAGLSFGKGKRSDAK